MKKIWKFINGVFNNNGLFFTLLIVIIGCVILVYFNDYFINKYKVQEIIPLYSFDKINKTLNYALSVLTVMLLYLNFKLQQDEFRNIRNANEEMVKANQSMVKTNEKTNEIQIVLSEKGKIDEYITEDFDKISTSLFEAFNEYNFFQVTSGYDLVMMGRIINEINEKELKKFLESCKIIERRIQTLTKIIEDEFNLKIITSSFHNDFINLFERVEDKKFEDTTFKFHLASNFNDVHFRESISKKMLDTHKILINLNHIKKLIHSV
ncbi:hypothetical protein MATR_11490 [Marivirga tractuosa]|uniref:Uncharacterized protein n=1 Tax=Marivirga tractuosa (strain ATCC 23168 / DSM 4126 / NBRC 15989 / NCIMB 1408 / VKM B-1430 / H-43) TaxID=643867 RepID=E4TKQ6_MARTH|nr:hypothetical protein [Marivirga tractuosa]ADR21222.1 hypothetical protein Ftrac_1229 [Marivirga tractuosa DSM 4126]BDD14324.1 hypothetical protein MATR_11490 [Marivirga tractuosa]